MSSLPPVRMGRQWHRACRRRRWKKGPDQDVANREERANRSERFRGHCKWNQTGEISCSDKGFSSRRDIPRTRTCWLEDPRFLTKERHEGFLEQAASETWR